MASAVSQSSQIPVQQKEGEGQHLHALSEPTMALMPTPDIPIPLFVAAAAMPATCVPCPTRSPVPSEISVATHVSTILDSKSGWLDSIPVSTMAIFMVSRPRVPDSHTSSQSMSASSTPVMVHPPVDGSSKL